MPLSILGVSLFFGALHLANPGQHLLALINTALIAIWLGLITWKQGNLRFALGFHFTWNASLALLYGMLVSGLAFEESLFVTEVNPP